MAQALKILQIIDTLNIGGAEKVLVTLANAQHRHGQEVEVWTLLEPGLLAAQLDSGIPVHALRRGWKWNPVPMFRLVRTARHFDLLHIHSSHNLRYVFLAAFLFGLRKPLFFHEHYGDIEQDQSVRWHQRLIYPRVILIGVSQAICNWATQRAGVPAGRVHLLYNIVPLHPVMVEAKQPRVAGETRILVTANIRRTKHIEFALQVFARFRQKQAAQLTIIGQVADATYFDELQSLVKELGLSAQVEFVHDCTEIQPLLPGFDLALHTARSESGPLVLIEYLAQGLPLLSYRTGEIARMLEEEFPECVCDDFDIEHWLLRMERLLNSDRSVFKEKAQRFYGHHFSENTYYQKCNEIYRQGLAS